MIGQFIYGYEITASLGEGGMGKVYRATDNTLGREVALKMLHPNLTREPMFLERFKKEARVLARLLHPNIAVIYNFIEQNGDYFMVMEYVEGSNLDELLKKYHTLPLNVVVPVVIQALEGLQHAHKKDILHRDIKPSNMMITTDGILKLMDFGIAKIANEQKITQVNKIVGTIEFMAPELIEGKEASIASDIYAMGIAMYELVAGKLPFENDTDYNLMQSILKKKPLSPDKLNASLPHSISDIILKSIEKKPENRYADAKAFQKALIEAFPGYQEIDLSLLTPPALSGQLNPADALTRIDQDGMQTRVESVPKTALSSLTFPQKILSGKKLPLIIGGAGLLAFIIFVLSIVIHKNKKDSIVLSDTLKKTEQNNPIVTNSSPVTIVPVTVTEKTLPENKPVETEIAPLNPENPPQQKKKAEKNAPISGKSKKESIATPVEKKETEKPVSKPVEKKEIFINSKVEVNLYLRESINTSGKDREQNIAFSVASPVVYEGLTIIKQGALATGTIKIGKILTSITINSVTAANGQVLSFKPDHIRRKKNDLESDRNYSAILEKGVKMNF
jgi:serine/threonine protein kinase